MNNKLVRKLALSAVTLGVAALSVTTTTFAWFTSNGTATASTVTGTVKDADANLLIRAASSETGLATATWGTSATLAAADSADVKLAPVSIVPSTGSADGSFYYVDGTSKADTKAVLTYYIQLNASDITANKTITANFDGFTFSTDSTKASQYLLKTAGGTTVAGDTVEIGLDEVLCAKITSSTSDASAASATNSYVTVTNNAYRYDTATDAASDTTTASHTGADAVTYYNNVLGYSSTDSGYITRPTTTYAAAYDKTTSLTTSGTANDITIATIAAPSSGSSSAFITTKIEFFIDGWDYQCFNAIAGSKITAGSIKFNIA